MAKKIIGSTIATPMPRSNWAQTDETKSDFIRNKPNVVEYVEQELTDEQKLTVRSNIDTMSKSEIEECVNNAVSNTAGIQIITWEADD